MLQLSSEFHIWYDKMMTQHLTALNKGAVHLFACPGGNRQENNRKHFGVTFSTISAPTWTENITLVIIRKWSERTWKLRPRPELSLCALSVRQTVEKSSRLTSSVSLSPYFDLYGTWKESPKSSWIEVWGRGHIQVSFITSSRWCCNNRKLVS